MLKVTRGNHHRVDILTGQHLLGVLIGLRFQVERFLYLGRPVLSRRSPEITDRNRFHGDLLGRQFGHVNMTLTAVAAAELAQTNAVVCSQHARIRPGIHPRGQHRATRLLNKRTAVNPGGFRHPTHLLAICTHTSRSYRDAVQFGRGISIQINRDVRMGAEKGRGAIGCDRVLERPADHLGLAAAGYRDDQFRYVE